MCAINGIFAYHYAANPIRLDELVRTRDHMAARGPDGCGLFLSNGQRLGLGHRRLSIIDLSEAGAQPMLSGDGKTVVTFNGEIYNHQDLRRRLQDKGHVFKSKCDTEILLHLYAEKGADMVHDLRGMFAFSIWDDVRRTLFLARDPYGIKPLYYADDGWTFRFASQVKALLAGENISREPDSAGLVGFYLLGHVPEPFTIHREIRALPAGATLLVDQTGAHEPRRFHSIVQVYREAERSLKGKAAPSYEHVQGAIHAALLDSVRLHLVADVPVGAFLSGGIDSSVLVSLMRQAGQSDIQTVTLAFKEFGGLAEDEAPLASEVAKLYGTSHATRIVTQSEFIADLPLIFDSMDQPSVDGINSWFVAKAARELGLKVAVSGLGGDELFGGYALFRDVPRSVRLLGLPARIPMAGRLSRSIGRFLTAAFGLHPKTAGVIELGGTYPRAYLLRRGIFMPWELKSVLARDIVDAGLSRLAIFKLIGSELEPCPASAFSRVSALESSLYMRNQLLRDTDWASMAHGLEVRVPLVDSVLLSNIAAASCTSPTLIGKRTLASAASPPLPEVLRNKPKTGFMTPIETWQRAAKSSASHASSRPRPAGPWARSWAQTVIAS